MKNIDQLTSIIKKKLSNSIKIEKIFIIDETFKHLNHKFHSNGKYHIIIEIYSSELKKKSKLNSSRLIYGLLDYEIKNFIHSLQLKIY
tara:strand:+ start:1081 stop:1344 length:264 start_codon:yes stop_codon:yes gene_type:complete